MEEEEEACKLGIELGLGSDDGGFVARVRSRSKHKKPVQLHLLFPLHPKQEIISSSTEELHSGEDDQSSSMAVVHEEEKEDEHKINIISDCTSNKKYGPKKKLKLTKEQLALLEDCFKRNSSLNMTQKQELAVKLNLKPRQVEVWFQNRRASTKKKQAEVECEVLRRCFESLSKENKKLKKELQELMRPTSSHLCFQVPTMCPYCEDERNKEHTSSSVLA